MNIIDCKACRAEIEALKLTALEQTLVNGS